MEQQVKEMDLSLQQLGSWLWHDSIPGPGTSACHWHSKKKEKEKKPEKPIYDYYSVLLVELEIVIISVIRNNYSISLFFQNSLPSTKTVTGDTFLNKN